MQEILDKKFDKKVAGIIRWLERLKKSYSSGSMEIALMDAECARADLENLRLDVWATLDPKAKPENKFFSRILNFARISSIAAVIVLLTVFPTSKEIPAPALEHDKEKITLAEPIIIIREKKAEKIEKIKNENQNNIIANNSVKAKKQARTANIKKPQPVAQEKIKVNDNKKEPEQKAVAYDKVFSLMQTGERALKNNSSVIKTSRN
mgnify:CR=1 FL=1